ncbi:MAG TPA: uroporphyrinogen-III synthase [Actinomycetota bacterium]|nr:uroporphyrinogen-III synthase [Actinomycetota bacterium]
MATDPAPTPSDALAGLTVAAPATRRAIETAALIRRWGGEPLVAPLLEEIPVEDEGPLRAATDAVLAAPATWSVHLTGVGTRAWFERAAGWGQLEALLGVLGAGQIVARGQKTSAALGERGLRPVWVPEGETSAEIAAGLGGRLTAADTVAIQLSGEPVRALSEAVAGAGARPIEVAPYRWSLPTDPADRERAEAFVRSLAAGGAQAIVVTSAVQATHLFAVARGLGVEEGLRRALTSRIFVAAVGGVARRGLEAEGVASDLVADPPRLGALLRALAAAAPAVRSKAGV